MIYTYRDIIKLKFPHKHPLRYIDNTYEGIVWNQLDETSNLTRDELDLAIQKEIILNTNLTSSSFIKTIQISSISGTSRIPYNNTEPTVLDGTEILRTTFDATNSLSKLLITGSIVVNSTTSNRNIILALFKNNICIGVTCTNFITSNRIQNLAFAFNDTELGNDYNTTTPVYTLRLGASGSTV